MIDSIDKIDWKSMTEDATHFGLENNCWEFGWNKSDGVICYADDV